MYALQFRNQTLSNADCSVNGRAEAARASGRGKASIKTRKIMKSLCSGWRCRLYLQCISMEILHRIYFTISIVISKVVLVHFLPIIRSRCRSSLFPLIRPRRLLSADERSRSRHRPSSASPAPARTRNRPACAARRRVAPKRRKLPTHVNTFLFLNLEKPLSAQIQQFQFNENANSCIFK